MVTLFFSTGFVQGTIARITLQQAGLTFMFSKILQPWEATKKYMKDLRLSFW